MPVELCRVTTPDGLLLDGALHRPSATTELPVDVFLLVHGTGSNFYAPGVLETFAEQSERAGVAAVRINTRGHDGMARIPGTQRSVAGGASYEIISECRLDIQAWIDELANRGFSRIGVVGHSMGGVKSIYALAHDAHPAVRCCIGISPPRFCHANFMHHPQADGFRADFQHAQQLVADGRGDELMTVKQPLPMLLTAEGFIAKYGPHDEYDYLHYLPKLTCPTLILIGTESVRTSPAFDGLPEELERLAVQHQHLELELIEGADTNYSACLEVPFERARQWLSELPI